MSGDTLVLVLGDQLDRHAAVLDHRDPGRDRVVMVEARGESRRIPSHKARTALFLAAMRHHRDWLRRAGYRVDYTTIDAPAAASLETGLRDALRRHRPRRVLMTEAGEYHVQGRVAALCAQAGVALEVRPDGHFLCSREAFTTWSRGRKTLVMEHFYRRMRQDHHVLLEEDGRPVGGRWNFDRDNRRPFGKEGPGPLPRPPAFAPDPVTRGAMTDVEAHFPDNPGSLDAFAWPVTREQALEALEDFVAHRLPGFGAFQDAMWTHEPFLHHALLSAALNLKLLHPREVIDAALEAWRAGAAPLASVEGFVRQVLGWREFVRGVYWSAMPGYLDGNALGAEADLPAFYWTGDTEMACLRQVIGQTLERGYAHHIQRLMVTGLFALLLGVRPRQVHEWYLAVYVDAVEWVEAPNTLGMSLHADGGLLASKPYAASGRYIQRMSNYCRGCRYDPGKATGERACPFTTLYWDFLIRHQARFADHPRAGMQWRSLGRLDGSRRAEIGAAAAALQRELASAG